MQNGRASLSCSLSGEQVRHLRALADLGHTNASHVANLLIGLDQRHKIVERAKAEGWVQRVAPFSHMGYRNRPLSIKGENRDIITYRPHETGLSFSRYMQVLIQFDMRHGMMKKALLAMRKAFANVTHP